MQLLALHVELIQLLVKVFRHRLPGGLPLLDLDAHLVEGELGLVELLAQLLGAAHAELLGLPLLAKVGELLAERRRFLLDFHEPLLGVLFGLLGELAGSELELHEPPLHFVDLARHALQFHRDPARGLVHKVDGLVGQEAIGDVPLGELGRGHERRILDLHPLVVRLIAGLQAAEDRDRVFHARLAHHHRLKPPLERRIFFDVLAILVERRGPDAAQLAAGQGRLEQVRRVGATLGCTGPDHGVQFINEQNDVARGRLDLAQDRLEPVFELAAILRAGDQCAEVEGYDAAALERLGHVGLHDPQGQALGDRRLAHARLTDEHGIVLRAAREHLDHAADFGIAADHGIELALAGPLREVDAVFFEGLKLFLGVLVGDARLAPHRLQPRHQLLLAHGRQLEHVLRLRGHLHECEQLVIGRDELVFHRVRLGGRRLEHLHELLVGLRLGAAAHLRQVRQLRLGDPLEVPEVHADLLKERPHDPLALGEEGVQQMHGRRLRVAAARGKLHGPLHRLLGLDRELVESKRHDVTPDSFSPSPSGRGPYPPSPSPSGRGPG